MSQRKIADNYTYHEVATHAFQKVMGSVVKEVLVEKYALEHYSEFRRERFDEKNNSVRVDGLNVVVVFTNGKAVEMTNSEWGCFTDVKI